MLNDVRNTDEEILPFISYISTSLGVIEEGMFRTSRGCFYRIPASSLVVVVDDGCVESAASASSTVS